MKPIWARVAAELGLDLDATQDEKLSVYRRWLVEEALPAGAIGPGEIDRLDNRHLADSLLFALDLDHPSLVLDLGSGAGLPGIPLAIALPRTRFLLVERSGRRVDGLKRVVRILDLGNCEVWKGDIKDLEIKTPALVSRASLSPVELIPVAKRLLLPGGVAVVGGSWVTRPEHPGWSTTEIVQDSLDHPVWLLIMRVQ